MKIYYVSHPYGGKQKNEAKAGEIVRALQAEYPDVCFVSPGRTCPAGDADYCTLSAGRKMTGKKSISVNEEKEAANGYAER